MSVSEPSARQVMYLSGDQAVARGALEAGISVATGYPGNPSTRALEFILRHRRENNVYAEWSTNEKVAVEVAAGVAWAGKRALVTMKMSGLNVAADSLLSIAHSGTNGGLAIYVADDVGTYYGMVEQDSRYYALLGAMPMLLPADPQEAKDMTIFAYTLSEEVGAPVMVRSTTAVANSYQDVAVGQPQKLNRWPHFERRPEQFTKAVSAWCLAQHANAMERLERAQQFMAPWNPLVLYPQKRLGVVAAGVCWQYLQEVLSNSDIILNTLKLDSFNPFPREKMGRLLSCCDGVLILEELEPLIEWRTKALALEIGARVKIEGKEDGFLPRVGDYTVNMVQEAVWRFTGRDVSTEQSTPRETPQDSFLVLPREPHFCPGCPHIATYQAIKQALRDLGYKKEEVITTGDIGCTIIGMHQPFEVCWTEVAMGSSIGLAQGFKLAGLQRPVLAAIGDGTFFHAGIPGLLNAVKGKIPITVVVLDNGWIAMTGHQPHPGTGVTAGGELTDRADIAALARACGVQDVKVVDSFYLEALVGALKDSIRYPGVSVVISKGECALTRDRRH